MDEKTRLYIDIEKRNLQNTFTSGAVKDAAAQYAVLENSLHKLLLLDDSELNKVIKKYFDMQNKLQEEIEELNQGMQERMDEYGKNAKEIYEEIKKL